MAKLLSDENENQETAIRTIVKSICKISNLYFSINYYLIN